MVVKRSMGKRLKKAKATARVEAATPTGSAVGSKGAATTDTTRLRRPGARVVTMRGSTRNGGPAAEYERRATAKERAKQREKEGARERGRAARNRMTGDVWSVVSLTSGGVPPAGVAGLREGGRLQ
jgi:hypothetical protein